jgi:hypothetical protein
VGQELLGPSYFFTSLVLGPLNSSYGTYLPKGIYGAWLLFFVCARTNKRHHHHTGLGLSSLVAHVLQYPPPPHAREQDTWYLGRALRRAVPESTAPRVTACSVPREPSSRRSAPRAAPARQFARHRPRGLLLLRSAHVPRNRLGSGTPTWRSSSDSGRGFQPTHFCAT